MKTYTWSCCNDPFFNIVKSNFKVSDGTFKNKFWYFKSELKHTHKNWRTNDTIHPQYKTRFSTKNAIDIAVLICKLVRRQFNWIVHKIFFLLCAYTDYNSHIYISLNENRIQFSLNVQYHAFDMNNLILLMMLWGRGRGVGGVRNMHNLTFSFLALCDIAIIQCTIGINNGVQSEGDRMKARSNGKKKMQTPRERDI